MNHVPGYVRPGGKSYIGPDGILYCTDGKLRWVYEIDQRKKPTVLYALLGKYVGLCAAIGLLILLVQFGTGGLEAMLAGVPVGLSLVGVGAALAAVSYGTRLLQNGPYVCLVFAMDEQSAACRQVKGRTDKASVTHAFAVWVGGQSQPAVQVCAQREVRLDAVRAVAADAARNRIVLWGKRKLVLCTEPQQFEPVLTYLKECCPNAR